MQPERPGRLLDIAGITAGYRQLQVLWGVDVVIHDHESVVLLGANGAGKTTLLKAIMRLVDIWAGYIAFAGEEITGLRTDQRVGRGIVFMSETSGFPGLTVEENVLIGTQFLPRHRARERMDELYAVFPALAERRRAPAGSLSGGQRKMLGIAKTLVGDPRLLIMDEPSAGLSPLYVKEVITVLAQFRSKQLALLIAEQNVKFLALADRVYTLDNGRIGFFRNGRGNAGERRVAPRLFRLEGIDRRFTDHGALSISTPRMVPAGELLASYANEATAEPLLDKRKVICAPAGAGRRHQDAAYPLKDGLEVRGAAKDPLGCALALPFDEVSLRPFHRDR